MSNGSRAFVALDLDDASTAELARLAERLRADDAAPRASFGDIAKLHVTLKFFDSLAEAHVDAMARSVRAAAAEALRLRPSVRARALAVSAFPTPSRARVIVVPIADADDRIAGMERAIDLDAAALGYAREPRAFKPHATLARLRTPANASAWLARHALTFEIGFRALVLYKSVLAAGGAVHTELASVVFAR